MILEQIKAFAEYVIRPMTDDIRQILEKAKELNLPISEKLIMDVTHTLTITYLVGELLRLITYIAIVVVVCITVTHVL